MLKYERLGKWSNKKKYGQEEANNDVLFFDSYEIDDEAICKVKMF